MLPPGDLVAQLMRQLPIKEGFQAFKGCYWLTGIQLYTLGQQEGYASMSHTEYKQQSFRPETRNRVPEP